MKLKHKILIPIALILYTIGYILYWQRDVRAIQTPGRRITSYSPEMRRLMQKQKVDSICEWIKNIDFSHEIGGEEEREIKGKEEEALMKKFRGEDG